MALDEQGTAKGRLYVDDGSSFAFLKGQYLDADIKFESGLLTYTPNHVGVQYTLTFERVIILGWRFSAPGATYTAKIQQPGAEVVASTGTEVEMTRSSVFGGSEATALIVRNPLTRISKPWTLEVQEM